MSTNTNPAVEKTISNTRHLLGEVYETLDDVKKVIRLVEEFPVNNLSLSNPESSHGLFVVLEHAYSLIDGSIEKINCVNKEIYSLEQEQGKEANHGQ